MCNFETDTGTEELAHMEMICAIVHQLTRDLSMEEIEKSGFATYYVDHTIGVWPTAAAGIPFNACEFQVKGDIITDLTEDMAAEAVPHKHHMLMRGGGGCVQKLKNVVLEKMLASHMTKAEVDVLLELSHYQDDRGKIYGVYYRSVCKAVGISYETYYTTLESLTDKGLIRVEQTCRGDRDVTILNNDFSYPGALQEGYIGTGQYLFDNKKFQKLKAGEKLLAMQLFRITEGGKHSYNVGIDFFIRKYTELLKIKLKTLRVYLTRLKRLFNITVKNKNYCIRIKAEECRYEELEAPATDLSKLSEYLIKTACRRNKANYTAKAYKEILEIIRQYLYSSADDLAYLRKNFAPKFLAAVKRSVELGCDRPDDPRCVPMTKSKWLNPKFIHKLLRQKF